MLTSLLVDKHRPKALSDLDYHPELSQRIAALAKSQDFPHCLFYGPSGAGKKTRITATLRELFGPGVEKLRIDQRVFLTPSKRKLDVNIVQSNYHIELTPSDVAQWDRTVIQDILKEIAQTQQIDAAAKKRFKVVVINEADLLTRDAQAALRRTMEKYTTNMRVILCANSTARIIGPIRSRCLLLRVGAPTDDEIVKVLSRVASKEKWSPTLPEEVGQLLARSSGGNLRRALLSLEALHAQNPKFSDISTSSRISDASAGIPLPDWETYTVSLAKTIVSSQSPDQILKARGMLYELLVHCIPATLVLTTLTKRLLEKTGDDKLKADIVYWASWYEHRLKQGSKPIFHLEAFVTRVMSLLKAFAIGFVV